ncbi:MAG: hypothetical protein ACP5PB_04495 [Acidimicrobiales bacterium]
MGDEMRESDRAPGGEGLASDEVDEFGGDPVCWAHLLCWDCGVVLTPGVEHRSGCQAGDGALGRRD